MSPDAPLYDPLAEVPGVVLLHEEKENHLEHPHGPHHKPYCEQFPLAPTCLTRDDLYSRWQTFRNLLEDPGLIREAAARYDEAARCPEYPWGS
jgi:hypothetical protein